LKKEEIMDGEVDFSLLLMVIIVGVFGLSQLYFGLRGYKKISRVLGVLFVMACVLLFFVASSQSP
jgi:purine-cytosine permease-like protein